MIINVNSNKNYCDFITLDSCLNNEKCGWCTNISNIFNGLCVQIFPCGPYFSENCQTDYLISADITNNGKCSLTRYFSYHQFLTGLFSGSFAGVIITILIFILIILIKKQLKNNHNINNYNNIWE
jgi:hypothetical protein